MKDSSKPLNVLVVGSGMYVCGIGTQEYGTILPALFEGRKENLVGRIAIAGTNPAKQNLVQDKVCGLNGIMGLDIPVEYHPQDGDVHSHAYRDLAATGDFDCAIVSVPDHLHFEVTKDLIESGLHCLVVKPLVTRLREVDELIRLQHVHKVYCAVEFHKRFDETNLHMRRLIRENGIGDILYALVEYSQRKSVPLDHFRTWSSKTNIFQYLGVHYVDIIYFCTGAIPQRVMAVGQKRLLLEEGVNTHDAIQVSIEWKPANPDAIIFNSVILTNWIDPMTTTAMSDQKIKFMGTTGRIECDQKERGLKMVSDRCGVQDINPYFSNFRYNIDDKALEFSGYGCKSIFQFIRDCSNLQNGNLSLKTLSGLRAAFQEARISTAVLEAVNESLDKGGTWVTVPMTSA